MSTQVPSRAVIFDWDGTLLNSFQADVRAYLQMFGALGIAWGLAELTRHYSPDWHNVYRAAKLPTECWGEADRLWRHFYRAQRPVLQPGARSVVQELSRKYRLALVTSGSGGRVRAQLRAFAFTALFPVCVFGDEAPRRKPHPAPLLIAMRRLGVEPTACVYIGDAPEDVKMARRAGVPSVGVLAHSPVPDRLRASRPGALISRITELPGLLSRD
ncbi:MAG TPA: HAD family hydrolase [Candidatus Acidoferrales bacterium]